jgi:hypothetical protein
LADITVAVKVPVDGLKNSFVLDTLAALIEPEVAVVNTGKNELFVEVSLVIVVPEAGIA